MTEQIFYKFIKLNLTQFATFDVDFADDERPIELSSSFLFAYNFDDDIVCCTTAVIMSKDKVPVLKAELDSLFKIQEDSVKSMTEDECVVLPVGLMTQFASLGYGAMRGVIYAKTMGTPLSDIVLPPNDVQSVFNEPAKFRR